MAILVSNAPQRSDEWRQLRAGRLTASVVSAIYGRRKDGKETAERRDLRTRLALERILGKPLDDGYVNADMQRGIDLEAQARACYEMRIGLPVSEVGFVYWDDLMVGCSPDGLVQDNGIIQIKCPRPANLLAFIRTMEIPEDYRIQMIHELMVTGRDWCDYVNYCPDLPGRLMMMVKGIGRDEVAAHELNVRQFLREVDEEEAQIRALQERA